MVKTYAFQEVSAIFGGIIVSGFMDGSVITVTRDEAPFKKKVGVDGTATRSKSNNKGGTIKLVLQQTSQTNLAFTAMHEADMLANTGVAPFTIVDAGGQDIHFSPAAWIQGPPEAVYGEEVEGREWIFDCGILNMTHGGTPNTEVQ